MTTGQQATALRDRKRRAVQDEVAMVAVELFLRQGYDITTVEQIASAAGLSPRSFFRYFAGKDDVMSHLFAATGTRIVEALDRRPAAEPPWVALRRAFDGLIERISADDRSRDVTRLIYTSPVLYAGHLHKQAQWSAAIADALAPRLRSTAEPSAPGALRLRAGALASAAVSCLEVARSEWFSGESGKSLGELTDDAMTAVASVTQPQGTQPQGSQPQGNQP